MLGVCLWMGYKVNTVRQEEGIATLLAQHNVRIIFDYEQAALSTEEIVWGSFIKHPTPEPPGPQWIRARIGDAYFRKVTAVSLSSDKVDTALPLLKQLPHLREIYFSQGSCGMCIPTNYAAQQKLKRELPRVKITPHGSPPIVG